MLCTPTRTLLDGAESSRLLGMSAAHRAWRARGAIGSLAALCSLTATLERPSCCHHRADHHDRARCPAYPTRPPAHGVRSQRACSLDVHGLSDATAHVITATWTALPPEDAEPPAGALPARATKRGAQGPPLTSSPPLCSAVCVASARLPRRSATETRKTTVWGTLWCSRAGALWAIWRGGPAGRTSRYAHSLPLAARPLGDPTILKACPTLAPPR